MHLDFISRALIAGFGIALLAGPLGSVMVWRRMANFGDTLAHSTLLGLCFSLLFQIHLYFGLLSVCMIMAGLLALFSRQTKLANDTVLCILAYTSLAIGLILATLLKGVRIDLLGYLFGDILAVNNIDLLWILGADVVVIFVLAKIWRSLLSITIHEDLAKVEGVSVVKVQWFFITLLAIVFAVAMKLIGVLLMTALLIIPAASARQMARSPEQMAIVASGIGVVSVYLGITFSANWDWPAGPAIVVGSIILFLTSYIFCKINFIFFLKNK